MLGALKKIFGVSLQGLSPKLKEWFQLCLTKLMDFLEKHFNNIVKYIFGIGGSGLGIGLALNLTDTIVDGATEKFSFFSSILGLSSLFSNLSQTLTPYMTHWNCSFIQAFSAFGGISAVNTIMNSCAYALIFWLCVVAFKWVIGLIPVILQKIV